MVWAEAVGTWGVVGGLGASPGLAAQLSCQPGCLHSKGAALAQGAAPQPITMPEPSGACPSWESARDVSPGGSAGNPLLFLGLWTHSEHHRAMSHGILLARGIRVPQGPCSGLQGPHTPGVTDSPAAPSISPTKPSVVPAHGPISVRGQGEVLLLGGGAEKCLFSPGIPQGGEAAALNK